MGKTVWTGTISYGLLNVDAALESATGEDPKDVSFKQLCPCHHEPVSAPRMCRTSGDVIDFERLEKGVETAKGTYAVVNGAALDDIDESFRDVKDIIEIQFFAPASEVAPTRWKDGHYYVKPYGKGVPKSLALLHRGLADTGTVGIGQIVMRSRQYLCAIYATGDTLGLSLLFYDSSVRTPAAECKDHKDVQLSKREIELVQQLVQTSLKDTLDLSSFSDAVVERKAKAVAEVVAGKKVTKPKAKKKTEASSDLEQALEKMLQQARGDAPKPKKARKAA
jgi:DNA end-binding protein Ku